jgi:SPOR domain
MDPATRKLAMIAVGIGGALLVVVGGWTMVSHRTHGVPVVEADGGPLRVKPANPGGLQVAGAGNDIFSGGSDTDVDKLAPPPETPDPQGLNAVTPPKPAASVVARSAAADEGAPGVAPLVAGAKPAGAGAAAPLPTPPALATRTSAPAAAPIASAPKPVLATAAQPARTPETRAAGADHGVAGKRAVVQLAALTSEQAARAEWEHLAKRWPELFGGHQPAFSKIDHGGQVLWRVRTGGFEGVGQATAFCERLRATGGACSVADF